MTPILRIALEEDIGAGDVTTRACVSESQQAHGRFLAREPLVVAGLGLLSELYDSLTLYKRDGDRCQDGEVIAEVNGPARLLLERERVALNFLQRLSGVATLARQFADAVEGTGCRVLDTRKTTPGLRALEKAAAAAGGVTNHRMGLFDAVLIKNNHIAAAGGVRAAIERARASGLPIEIEVRTHAELHEALDAGAAHLLLDNLTPAEAADWVREIAGRARVELSGGINLETVRAYAETGADFVSAGAITHSARAMDISFRLELGVIALDIDRIRRAFPQRSIAYYGSIDSTMRAAAGGNVGDVILAEEQTAGQGRHGHSWHSVAGDGIYCSIVLPQSPVLTLALGLAAHSAIFEATGQVCDLRWPNDLMLADKKVAGILVQAAGKLAIAGIGINVNQTGFPEDVASLATSLRLQAGRPLPREEILLALLPAVDTIVAQDKQAILNSFTHLSSYASGKRVEVQQEDGVIVGTTAGLDPAGFLIVRRDDGTDTLIVAGGVRAARS